MPVLRSIESKLESLFEGVFGRAFRTNVQPVELARKLVKEMDDHRNVSVSRVYVPNEYTIYLAPADREQFASYETQLTGELAEYLAEHARRESYALLTPPRVLLETDDDLDVGMFGIATRLAQVEAGPSDAPEAAARRVRRWSTSPCHPSPRRPRPPRRFHSVSNREIGVLTWDGGRHEATRPRAVVGRSKDADIQVADPNVSRRHAELRREGSTYWLVDLDSTNGVEVKGKRVKRLEARGRDCASRSARRRSPSRGRLTAAGAVLGSAQVETTLLALKIAFLVLLYLFIWRIVRSATRDLRPAAGVDDPRPRWRAAASRAPAERASGRLVVLESPALGGGDVYPIDTRPLTVGRGADNDVALAGDEYASGRHARFEPPARRRLPRGHRLDERHLRQRDPADP